MSALRDWRFVPYMTLEDRGVMLPKRYSVSLSLDSLFPRGAHTHEFIEREGLGPWRVLTLSSIGLGFVVIGGPDHVSDEFGASVWAGEGVEPADLKGLLTLASQATGYEIVDADG